MLDTVTKRRIDTARDILVGKVPDPKSQVEQITIALIYKFMHDMDVEFEELGGQRQFFAGDYAQYDWAKLMRSGLGGFETLSLYAEAIAKMPENPGIPSLFRDIFKNAYLPYRDPETLKSFLKIIDEFTYDHSERLGDAFEYLLSVLGSQGDAGQFRTPRHIIDFMVGLIDPKKDETILDPACGTAGFLISSYKHIFQANKDENNRSTLTPDEKGRLAKNFKGYDISPDMVRLSLVNLYLHGFNEPHIYEYDTLTSEDKWNELSDVILANPPFMSPKGGIKPHRRFSVKSNRSEVLFVDYIAEHLTPNGRAGVIVPEGIIFQNQTAYKDLRKVLVDKYIVAVISLPAGVFNPYSGVKTSILILDKSLARQSDTIAFFKVENDGFNLGAQRRPIEKNDLPQVKMELERYLQAIRTQQPIDEFHFSQALFVDRVRIAANGENNLSGERYRKNTSNANLTWPLLRIGELCLVERGASPRPIHEYITDSPDGVNWIKIGDAKVGMKYITQTKERVTPEGAAKSRRVKPGDFILSNSMSFGRPYIMATDGCIHDGWLLLREQSNLLDKDFLYHILGSHPVIAQFEQAATGGVVNNLNSELVRNVEIPLPPMEVQKEIVAEIEDYQKVIDGARIVLDTYRPRISIDPNWPIEKFGSICAFKRGPFGGSLKKEIFVRSGYAVYEQSHAIANDFTSFRYFIDQDKFNEMRGFQVQPGELIMSCSGTMGKVGLIPDNAPFGVINQALLKLTPTDKVLGVFLKLWMESSNFQQALDNVTYGAAIKNVASVEVLKELQIPLPPLEIQQEIVAEIEAEQTLVTANRELIERFEKKIQSAIARVWRVTEPTLVEI